jgi:hypothetical protein
MGHIAQAGSRERLHGKGGGSSMKRRTTMLGVSFIAIAATLGLSSAAVASHHEPGAAATPSAQAPKKIPLGNNQGTKLPDVQFLRTTSIQAIPKPALGVESIAPQRSFSKPVPKGNPGDAPYVAPAYATVPSLPIANASPPLHKTGVTGYEQRIWGGYSLEPPDTEICAGNGYLIQTVNNIIEIYDANGNELSPPMPAEYFFSEFVYDVFDPKCYWDPDTNHWFITWAVADFISGSFSGVYIAVSQTANPLAPWNIYFLDTTDPFGNTGCAGDSGIACLGDQPLLGADKWTLQISTNEFPLVGGFNGAGYFLIDKTALALGLPGPNVVGFDLGDVTTPDGACPTDSSGAPCWYSVQPAESSNANYMTALNGTAFALSALDFFGANDDRVAIWVFDNTRTISGVAPDIGGGVTTIGGLGSYGPPPFAVQPEGDNPLVENNGVPNVRDIQTNDDRMNEVDWNHRTGWLMGGLNTGANVGNSANFRAAVEWFGFRIQFIHGLLVLTGVKNGYIANAHADTIFPASTSANSGNGVWVYSLTGDNIYPSAAFSTFTNSSHPNRILISHNGVGPQDGFTEYCPELGCGSYRPRWGDYSGAVTTGNVSYWSTEWIGNSCTQAEYNATGGFCNGERGPNLNWDNSLAGAFTP